MEKAKMERISELTRISRKRPLTPAETEERELLRAEYLRDFRASMTGILDNSVIVRPDGSREKVSERKKSPDRGASAVKTTVESVPAAEMPVGHTACPNTSLAGSAPDAERFPKAPGKEGLDQ